MSLRESDIWSFVRFVVKKTSNHAAMDEHDIHDLVLRPWGILSIFCCLKMRDIVNNANDCIKRMKHLTMGWNGITNFETAQN